jgi:hypothetical protein
MIGNAIGLVFVFFLLVLYILSIVWAYGDAEDRGKSGCLVVLLVMFLPWPIGLIAWFVFRPNRRR